MNTLIERRDRVLARASAVIGRAEADGRTLTRAEDDEYRECVGEAEQINEQIRNNSGSRRIGSTGSPTAPLPADEIFPSHATDTASLPHIRAIPTTKLRAFANSRTGYDQAHRCGMWLRAFAGDIKAANWCAGNGIPFDIRAAHSASDNAKGGTLVPEEYAQNIIRLVEEFSVFRRNTTVIPMSSDTLHVPRRDSGLTAAYTGEGVAGDESDTSWSDVQLVAKKMMCRSRFSSELSDDATLSVADLLAIECAQAFALLEDQSAFLGDGTSVYGGHVGVLVKALDGLHDKAKVAAATNHNLLTEVDSGDLVNLMAALPTYAKMGAAWYCSPTALEVVFNSLKAEAGGNSLENLANAVTPRFLGYAIEVSSIFPDDPTADLANKAMIAFGNLAQASTLGSRRELRFAISDAPYFNEDQLAVKATLRHSIVIHSLGSNTAKGPFAVLVGTS